MLNANDLVSDDTGVLRQGYAAGYCVALYTILVGTIGILGLVSESALWTGVHYSSLPLGK